MSDASRPGDAASATELARPDRDASQATAESAKTAARRWAHSSLWRERRIHGPPALASCPLSPRISSTASTSSPAWTHW